ncbi:MAG TPA: CHAD domain-containing protein [Bacteroidales bacterium]|nr:CHAD domain-containing protein [Bacteroidales bacterium]
MDQDFIRLRDVKSELSSYISDAQNLLKKAPVPDDDSVHDMRVLLKKSRATLKLIESQVESEYKDKDIQSLKEAARLMTSWRDTTVYRKTLKELRKNYPELFERLSENQKLNDILKKPEQLGAPTAEMQQGIEQIGELLKKTAYRIRFQNMQNFDANLLLKELENTYLKVVGKFLECRNNPREAKLHEFRKKAKEFMYQLYFFRPMNNTDIKVLEKKLEGLTRNLGKINDIAQLLKALDYKYQNDLNLPALDELVVRMRERQDEYLMRVWRAASKIFCPGRNLVTLLGYKILVI